MEHTREARDKALVMSVISFEESDFGSLEMWSGDLCLLTAVLNGVAIDVAKTALMSEFFGFNHICIN